MKPNSAFSNPKKRLIVDSDSDPDDADWPRFIVLNSSDPSAPLSRLSPFAILKGINGIAGAVNDIKKLRSGQILVECARKAHADNLLRATSLANVGITASPHRTLNSSKGVIRARDLKDVDEEEITEELSPQGVTHVKRISIKKEGKVIPTNTFIVTFNRPTPPASLKVGYLNVKVDLYIPNPLRCFKCQKFGHGRDSCSNDVTCFRCGQKGHDNTNCQNPAKCANCQEAHMAISKDCPIWKKEKQIQKIKAERNISYPEARRITEASTQSLPSQTYAEAAKTSVRTVACQTECTWLRRDEPITFTPEVQPNKQSEEGATRTKVQKPTQTEVQHQTEKPDKTVQKKSDSENKKASGEPIKRSTSSRLPKAKKLSIPNNNRFSNLTDVEMEDMADIDLDIRRDRSRSPRNQSGKRSPVHPP